LQKAVLIRSYVSIARKIELIKRKQSLIINEWLIEAQEEEDRPAEIEIKMLEKRKLIAQRKIEDELLKINLETED